MQYGSNNVGLGRVEDAWTKHLNACEVFSEVWKIGLNACDSKR